MNIEITKEGQIIVDGKFRKLHYRAGYLRVKLNNKLYSVHRMVAEKYIPNPLNKPQVNHKNGIKDDNRVENLEWVTSSENNLHASRILGKKKRIIAKRLFNDEQVNEIRNSYIPYKNSCRKIAEEYGVSAETIRHMIKFKNYFA